LRVARRAARARMDRGTARTSRRGERAPPVLPHDARGPRHPDRRGRAAGTPRAPGESARPYWGRAMNPSTRFPRSGQAVDRTLLMLAPRELRERHGAAMEELFFERLTAARARYRLAVAAAWLHGAGDLLKARVAGWRRPSVRLTVHIDERTALMSGSDIRYA